MVTLQSQNVAVAMKVAEEKCSNLLFLHLMALINNISVEIVLT